MVYALVILDLHLTHVYSECTNWYENIYILIILFEGKEKYSTIMQMNSREPTAKVSFQSLTPNTEYTFRIIAINSDGISPPSEPSALRRTPGPGESS